MTNHFQAAGARVRGFISRPQPGDEHEFNALALELFALQLSANLPYRRFCESRRLNPSEVGHWSQIPALPARAFKDWDVTCLAPPERTHVFHSSGTTGHHPGRHFHHAASLGIYEASLLAWFRANVLSHDAAGRMLFLSPPPELAPHSSLAHMFDTIRQDACAMPAAFAGCLEAGAPNAWAIDLDVAVRQLRQSVAAREPVILLGTAFSFVHLLDGLAGHGERFVLPAGSLVMETGGYKGRSRSLPKTELHAWVTRELGVPRERIVCEYGMSELSSQAYACAVPASPAGLNAGPPENFRFPPWVRVTLVSPETGEVVEEGETGIIRVLDLANVYSAAAVQTEDLGIRRGTGFELVGRTALAEPRGCSLLVAA